MNLTKLFNLLQVTRIMPQYGYVLSGIKDPSKLAEHHYMVTMIAWQLARLVKRAGGVINVEKVLEFALIHDLGEMFGGDIAMPYAKANPEAKKLSREFERENQKYIANFFGDDKIHFEALSDEIHNASSDESRIAKIADYMEVTHYKYFIDKFIPKDVELVTASLQKMIDGMHDEIAKEELAKFIEEWKEKIGKGKFDQEMREMFGH
jgi:5'-deoxynucleotidase YfbR-like HD superfamily hydrolase